MNIKTLNNYLANADTINADVADYGTSEGARKAWLKRHAHLNPHERAQAWEKMTKEDLSDLETDIDDLDKSMAQYHQRMLAVGKHSTPEEGKKNYDAMNSIRKKLYDRGISVNSHGPLFTYTGKSGIDHELEGWKSLSNDKVWGEAKDGIFNSLKGAVKGAVNGWKSGSGNGGGQKPKTLEEHDKERHGGHFDPNTMTCSLRESSVSAKQDSDITGGHKILGGTHSGKSASAAKNYLALTKRDPDEIDDIVSEISMKHGPSSMALAIDPEVRKRNEENRHKQVRDALAKNGIDESSLEDHHKKELGLNYKITQPEVKRFSPIPKRTDQQKEADAFFRNRGLPPLPDGLEWHRPQS